MFVGHYSVAFAVRTEQNKIPLWALFVAVQFLDYIWATLVLLGIEKLRVIFAVGSAMALSRPGVCLGDRVACAGDSALSGTQCNSSNSQERRHRFRNRSRSYSDR